MTRPWRGVLEQVSAPRVCCQLYGDRSRHAPPIFPRPELDLPPAGAGPSIHPMQPPTWARARSTSTLDGNARGGITLTLRSSTLLASCSKHQTFPSSPHHSGRRAGGRCCGRPAVKGNLGGVRYLLALTGYGSHSSQRFHKRRLRIAHAPPSPPAARSESPPFARTGCPHC